MRTGVLVPCFVGSSTRDVVAWARTAEDLGFDSLGVRGRIVHDSLEPLVTLSLVAASTRRIELFLHLPAPSLARPRILARQIAGLERTSRGRLTVAVGGSVDDTWIFTGRDGCTHCITVVHVHGSERVELDAVRYDLDDFVRAGADDVLLSPASGDLRALETLADLRNPAFV
jgi:hypothetical protein